jgi:hypothetical protein
MADFTFAIVVPLASPIQPVATSTHDRGHVTTAHLIGAGGVQDFKMIPVEPGVNSSMENYVAPRSGACSAQCRAMRRALVGTNRLVMQRNKRNVQMHNSPNRDRYFASIALN